MAACDAASAAIERDPYDEAALRVLLRAHVVGGRAAGRWPPTQTHAPDGRRPGTIPRRRRPCSTPRSCEASSPRLWAGPGGSGLLGRDDELACLEAIAARARGGSAEVAVVDGEAGIGKTTLLRAWAGRRSADGGTVLIASCGPLDRAPPLDAVLLALAAACASSGPRGAPPSSAPTRRSAPGPDPYDGSGTAAAAGGQHARARGRGTRPGPGVRPSGGARAARHRGRRRAPGQSALPDWLRSPGARPSGDRGRRHPDRRGRAAPGDRVRPPARSADAAAELTGPGRAASCTPAPRDSRRS